MKIMVTGGNGFIGRHAVARLKLSGHDVVTPDLPDFDLFDAKKVNDFLQQERPSHLLHFAWYTEHGKFWNAEENKQWVRASFDLARNFLDLGGQRAVFAGSCAEYDWADGVCKEDQTPLNASTLYGQCKNELNKRISTELKDLSFAWGRIFFLYGPQEHPRRYVPQLAQGLIRGETVKCSDGKQVRDFMHAQDVGEAFAHVLLSDFRGSINIASGQSVTLREVGEILQQTVNRGRLDFGAIPRTANDPDRISADTNRLQNLGFKSRFDLQDGLRQIVTEWLK